MIYILIFLMGYAMGCLQSAYFVGRLYKIDIREHGSGNAGMTNIMRTLGAKAGIFVLVFDIMKGVGAIMLANYIYTGYFTNVAYYEMLPGLLAGFAVVVGHCFPFYLKFRGGKGIAATMGLIIMLDWRVMLISFSIALVTMIISRYLSLASLIGLLAFAVSVAIFYPFIEIIVLCVALASLCIFMHRSNISRIINKTERRIFSGRSLQKNLKE